MIVGIMSLHLFMRGAHSLKDRRRMLRSVKDRLRTQFNVSVAEVGDYESWQSVVLGLAAIGTDRPFVEGLFDKVVLMVRTDRNVELVKCEKEFV